MTTQSEQWEWVKGSELRPGDVVRAGRTPHGSEVFYERAKVHGDPRPEARPVDGIAGRQG